VCGLSHFKVLFISICAQPNAFELSAPSLFIGTRRLAATIGILHPRLELTDLSQTSI
jgi:hypothetical protein